MNQHTRSNIVIAPKALRSTTTPTTTTEPLKPVKSRNTGIYDDGLFDGLPRTKGYQGRKTHKKKVKVTPVEPKYVKGVPLKKVSYLDGMPGTGKTKYAGQYASTALDKMMEDMESYISGTRKVLKKIVYSAPTHDLLKQFEDGLRKSLIKRKGVTVEALDRMIKTVHREEDSGVRPTLAYEEIMCDNTTAIVLCTHSCLSNARPQTENNRTKKSVLILDEGYPLTTEMNWNAGPHCINAVKNTVKHKYASTEFSRDSSQVFYRVHGFYDRAALRKSETSNVTAESTKAWRNMYSFAKIMKEGGSVDFAVTCNHRSGSQVISIVGIHSLKQLTNFREVLCMNAFHNHTLLHHQLKDACKALGVPYVPHKRQDLLLSMNVTAIKRIIRNCHFQHLIADSVDPSGFDIPAVFNQRLLASGILAPSSAVDLMRGDASLSDYDLETAKMHIVTGNAAFRAKLNPATYKALSDNLGSPLFQLYILADAWVRHIQTFGREGLKTLLYTNSHGSFGKIPTYTVFDKYPIHTLTVLRDFQKYNTVAKTKAEHRAILYAQDKANGAVPKIQPVIDSGKPASELPTDRPLTRAEILQKARESKRVRAIQSNADYQSNIEAYHQELRLRAEQAYKDEIAEEDKHGGIWSSTSIRIRRGLRKAFDTPNGFTHRPSTMDRGVNNLTNHRSVVYLATCVVSRTMERIIQSYYPEYDGEADMGVGSFIQNIMRTALRLGDKALPTGSIIFIFAPTMGILNRTAQLLGKCAGVETAIAEGRITKSDIRLKSFPKKFRGGFEPLVVASWETNTKTRKPMGLGWREWKANRQRHYVQGDAALVKTWTNMLERMKYAGDKDYDMFKLLVDDRIALLKQKHRYYLEFLVHFDAELIRDFCPKVYQKLLAELGDPVKAKEKAMEAMRDSRPDYINHYADTRITYSDYSADGTEIVRGRSWLSNTERGIKKLYDDMMARGATKEEIAELRADYKLMRYIKRVYAEPVGFDWQSPGHEDMFELLGLDYLTKP